MLELTFFAELEERQKAWADTLKELLLEMKAEVERAREAGGQRSRACFCTGTMNW